MRRVVQILLAAAWLLLSGHAFCGPAEEASATIDQWTAAFNENNSELLSRLYAPDALLHSATSPLLYIANEAIREYFSSFRRTSNRASITERHMAVLSETVVMGVGFYKFDVVMNGQTVPRPARFTFILTKQGSSWLIAHHHASTVPPAPLQ
jgi:uncharacterized protein (TIGR02246 family)